MGPKKYCLVRSISSREAQKTLRLTDGRIVVVQRFACVGVGDAVGVDTAHCVWANTIDGEVQVTPAFQEGLQLEIVNGFRLPVLVREISEEKDLTVPIRGAILSSTIGVSGDSAAGQFS